MVLNRIFEPKDGDFTSTEIDNTSYIDPSKYNYIFAETSAESQNFWVQIGFGIESRSNFKNSKNINKNTKEAVNNRFFCVNKYAKSVNKHVDNL
jgi:hypothetical protein